MDPAFTIQTRLWLNWENHLFARLRVQVPETSAAIITFFIGFAFTFTYIPFEKICIWVVRRITGRSSQSRPVYDQAASDISDTTPMLNHHHGANGRVDTAHYDTMPPAAPSRSKYMTQSPLIRRQHWYRPLLMVIWAILGFEAALLPTGSDGVSSTTECGYYYLPGIATPAERTISDLYRSHKERRAGQYASTCYQDEEVPSFSCGLFHKRRVEFTERTIECPFRRQNICQSSYNVMEFDTGIQDSGVLGINSPLRPRFRRRTACTPLSMDGYVQPFVDNLKNESGYRYFYGPTDNDDYTLETRGDFYQSGIPAYFLHTHRAGPDERTNFWHPISGLARASEDDSYLTIIFIAAGHILFKGSSSDDIFHMDRPCRDNDDRDSLYRATDARARPLACIDHSEICAHDSDTCWPVAADDAPDDSVSMFVRFALIASNIDYAIKYRLGSALLAQRLVTNYRSPKLDDQQWILEMRSLFATSLARLQYDALDIATAADHRAGYRRAEPKKGSYNMCNMYKFRLPSGYANLNFLAHVFLLIGLILVFGFGQDCTLKQRGDGGHWETEVVCAFTWAGVWLWEHGLAWLWQRVIEPCASSMKHAWSRLRAHITNAIASSRSATSEMT